METILKFDKLKIPAANLGGSSPIPDIKLESDMHANVKFDDTLTKQESKYIGYGKVKGILPYRIQNHYDRSKTEKEFNTVVLENNYLKAVFVPEFGGRLWSLYDKQAGKPLLYENQVFQPANLALRDAWFSGGVEWNIGMIGHTPYTISPLYAATAELPDGTPVLRMYEFERIRRATYCIDAFLPKDSKFLFVKITIQNTSNHETPMYWWSNIAVPESEDVRVISPADEALVFNYDLVVKKPFPYHNSVDNSYSTRVKNSSDFFFNIDDSKRKWITSLDGNGYGLVQTSTDQLKGRKLFLWGNGSGGETWQEFLSVPDHKYIEIQAGLCRTQFEHKPMPAGATWHWLEAYGAMQADVNAAHSTNWQTAVDTVNSKLEKDLPRLKLEETLAEVNLSDLEFKIVSGGSYWGSIQRLLAENGYAQFNTNLIFSGDEKQKSFRFWKSLIENKELLHWNPSQEPAEYLIEPSLTALLEDILKAKPDWHGYLQLGIMYSGQTDIKKAAECFERSFATKENAWALVNLALLHNLEGEYTHALALVMRALTLNDHIDIAVEAAKLVNLTNQPEMYSQLAAKLPNKHLAHGRVKLALLHSLVEENKLEEALAILGSKDFVIDNLRENETILSDLWLALHKKILMKEGKYTPLEVNDTLAETLYPIPAHLDFRMRTQ